MKHYRTFCLILLVLTSQLKAQYFSTILTDFQNSLLIGGKLAASVYHNAPTELTYAAGIGALTLGDASVNDLFLKHQTSALDQIFNIDRFYGNVHYVVPTTVALYLGGLISRNAQWRQVGLQSMQAVFYSGLAVVTLKEIFGRARPYQQQGAYQFKPFSFEESWRSFPSGHAAIAFAFSTVMANSVSNFWWKSFWFAAAFTVAGARMYHNVHWLSDVVAGGLIGWNVGKIVTRNDNSKTKSKGLHFGFSPFSSWGLRFAATYAF